MAFIFVVGMPAFGQEYYILQHWVTGTVADGALPAGGLPVDPPERLAAGREVHVHAAGNETNLGRVAVTGDETYLVDYNEFDTQWYADAVPRTFQSMIHRVNRYGIFGQDSSARRIRHSRVYFSRDCRGIGSST